MSMNRVLALTVCLMFTASALAADFVWLEGEKPTHSNVDVAGVGWGNTQFLSDGQWLHINVESAQVGEKCPPEGIVVGYRFEAPVAGRYEVWNRIGFEFVRSPFEWRLDQSDWQTVRPEDLTIDLMEIGFWCEVAWIRMGDAQLNPGVHTLEIRLAPTYKEEGGQRTPERILYASDALCLYRGAFRPNLWHRPDADWETEADREAAARVFRVSGQGDSPERIETALEGDWQVCRYDEQDVVDRDGPTRTLPDLTEAFWMAIQVPGNKFDVKPELRLCHRFVYRARVQVPADLAGRSFFLRFPSLNLIASVFVNGQFCGWTKAPYALWECDVTGAVRAGGVNEVCVVVKDSYYAFSPRKSGKSCRLFFNVPVTWMGSQNFMNQYFDFPIGTGEYAQKAGILETPQFVVAGPVYASDVFVKPSVKRKELGLEITVANPGAVERTVQVLTEVVPADGGAPERSFGPREVRLQPGGQQVLTITEPWENPRLWWPDEPNMYQLATIIQLDGRVVDLRRTPFGFREWEWDGPQFRINGVPWQFFADTTLLDGGRDPQAAVRTWREHGQNMWRFWGRQFGGLSARQALDFMDAQGIVVRRSGIFDGQGANYLHGLADNRELFDNWIVQLAAQVKEERNHPSILIWSLENEITFINARNLGMSAVVEPEITRAAREVMALDPTRPVMVDGGNCLMDRSLPVNGVHYMESYWRDYPDEAYTLAKALVAHEQAVLPTWGKCPWQLMPDRPIFMGESFYARGNPPSAFAQFGGEGCFGGWGEHTRVGAGRLAKMLAEGYRWHGVAATHFWMSATETDLHYNSWQPVCVLCREWNWTFAGGTAVSRTLKAFNNTHRSGPLEVAWTLELAGARVAGDRGVLEMPAGGSQELPIRMAVPAVGERTTGSFTLSARVEGREVFREEKPVAVLPADAGPRPAVAPQELVVLDPAGTVRSRLAERGIRFTLVAQTRDIPPEARVVIIGKDALDPRDATEPRWMALASAGVRVLVLEQAHPLRYLAVPADLQPTDFCGRVAFIENPDHPAFAGLDQPDFFTWSGDHVVYRNAYRKATYGAVSLAQCDESLGYCAIAECPVNDGLLLLCQMVVGEKLATDPVAQRLFDNMVAYCANYAPQRRSTAVVMDPASPACKQLAASGLQFDLATDVLTVLHNGRHDIVVFDASPQNLRALADGRATVEAFTNRGGWLMAWGLTPEGLADFNRLVGVDHLLRPFELERVSLPPVRDPLLAGLTVRDVTMESGEVIFPWAGDRYLVDDEFTYIVDLDDIAPFCDFPDARAGDHAAAKAAAAGWSRNMVNGFTSADAWKLIYYMSTASPRVTLRLPREEEIRRLGLVLNTHYCVPTRVNLYLDEDPVPVALTTQPTNERQDFDLPRRRIRSLTIELADFDKPGQTTGIDNLWLYVTRSAQWQERVKPLLNIGGLVKYPMGRGGLILNQLNVKDAEPVPENLQKKRTIVATILRNLHATFAGGKVLTTANLLFRPLPFHEQCNQYLTRDRGWFEGDRDLGHLPHGQLNLEGVPYVVRDFKTSPAPSCIMLAGPGARGSLPQEVRGLQVHARADALFFLHTFGQTAPWRPGRPDEPPPVLFRYVVNYADGQTAEIPVIYGEGVGHWIARQPVGLKNASVAWSAPFPQDPSGEQAVLYQLQWTNPRPEVEIVSLDMLYGPAGSQYGTPALIALTAGTQVR